jgi:chemotaxis protein methyltransferase CheR
MKALQHAAFGTPPTAGGETGTAPAGVAPITDAEFQRVARWLRGVAGIHLSSQKKPLVMGRLAPRMRHHGLRRYGDYIALICDGHDPEETQIAVDLLTTNETQFFREPSHFDFLARTLVERPGRRIMRVWSAACASGEEPYSIAMILAAALGDAPWEVLASDLSTRMLAKAATGHYPMTRARGIPRAHLLSCCLKGTGSQDGTFLIGDRLRARVRFRHINLIRPLPDIGEFDVIFLRNVMIYFDSETKREVVGRVVARLATDGHLIVGHSESLSGVSGGLQPLAPSVYRKS